MPTSQRLKLDEPKSRLEPLPFYGYFYRDSSGLRPVANVVAGWVVVPPVQPPQTRAVEVYADRHLFARITYSVDAFIVGQYCGGPIICAP